MLCMRGAGGRKGARSASEAVQSEWARRVQVTIDVSIAQNTWTTAFPDRGLSEVLRDGLRIVDDELTHAELSHRTYLAAGGVGAAPLHRSSLFLARDDAEPLELAVGRTAVQVFCLGETVAVRLFKVLREGCSVKPARRALDRVLRDEVRHRDFGWALLDMLLELGLHSADFGPRVDREPRLCPRSWVARYGGDAPHAPARTTFPRTGPGV